MLVVMAANGMPPIPPPVQSVAAPPPNYEENGRLYHGYRKGSYMYPCDEQEQDRLDIYHRFFQVARHERLHTAPFTPNYDGPRILDIGTGTGIWAIDMADAYPNAEVLGIDISLIQPHMIPANLSFKLRDFDGPWQPVIQLESWDLIHMRMLAGSVSSWPEVYAKVFRSLKPVFGWIEDVEIDFYPRCDDGSLPPNSALQKWHDWLMDATERACKPLRYNHETRAMLAAQGFVDIRDEVIKIPLNPWERDSHQKDIGRWYNLGMTEGMEAASLGPFTRIFNWSRDDVIRLITDVKKEICDRRIHVYHQMHIWTARKPA